MNKIKSYFDDFIFHAWVMPVLVAILPMIIIALLKGFSGSNIMDTSTYLTISVVFLSFMSRISRELGKRFEEKMFKKLKAEPTTILMRFSDSLIDPLTKKRYHERLNNKIDNLNLPLLEKHESTKTDLGYKSAIVWLRNYANSNRNIEYRVYQELKEYNFWRNLYGSKMIMILLYVLIMIREIILMDNFNIKSLLFKLDLENTSIIILLFSIIFSIFFINKGTVKNKAFDYAKALIEVCERI